MPLRRHPNLLRTEPNDLPATIHGLLQGVPEERGACYGLGDMMFGHATREAKLLCGLCPITAECLSLALSLPQEDDLIGVWGGTTPGDRRKLRAAEAA